jgi:outer membrane protein assembly factor BamE (lipoprotein component of BamABCDE complex)
MPHPSRSSRTPVLLILLGLLLAVVDFAACGNGTKPGAGAPEADQEWLWLQRSKQELDRQREELAALGPAAARPAGAATSATSSATSATSAGTGGAAAPAQLAREVETLTAEFDRRIVDFVNAHPPVQGEPLTRRQQAALRMKSDEDLEIARQYAEKGGDFQRAAEICEAALAVDPDNPSLKEELEKIHAARFMTSDRFFEVKPGMTPPEVRELLGAPNLHNVHAYPDRGVEAWFYPRDAAGTAAGVWFEKRQHEEDTRVYQLDFDAIRPLTAAAPSAGAGGATPPPSPSGPRASTPPRT